MAPGEVPSAPGHVHAFQQAACGSQDRAVRGRHAQPRVFRPCLQAPLQRLVHIGVAEVAPGEVGRLAELPDFLLPLLQAVAQLVGCGPRQAVQLFALQLHQIVSGQPAQVVAGTQQHEQCQAAEPQGQFGAETPGLAVCVCWHVGGLTTSSLLQLNFKAHGPSME